jgi:mannitol/fructose-specific phosphotransferase system IIA component (Ntr-type)
MLKTLKNHAEGLVVGKGFAIPYTGFDKSVIHTGMSLIRLRDSVSFGHPSYDPVDLVCCLGANNTKSHLKAFFNLIHLAQKDEFKRQLRLAETTEEMNDIIKTYEIELNNTREVMV